MDSTSRRKRTRGSESPDSDNEKRRGRPRVEKADESAADRRRTQIRMAQRAYRQRKESTLEELRKRVAELTNTIELMNKAFVGCRDRLYASNLPQDLMIAMHETSVEFESLVKDVRNPDEEQVTVTSKPGHPGTRSSKAAESEVEMLPEPKNVPSWLDQSVLDNSNRPKRRSEMDIGMGYTMYPDDGSQPMDLFEYGAPAQELMPSDKYQQPFEPDSFDVLRADVPEPVNVTAEIEPPRTYSFQETTFARRLHRACVESAYQLVLDPRRKPAELDRIFRLSLMGRDRNKLTASLKMVLDRGPHEDLDFWEAPLIHVGGAGTHYARRDPYGNLLPKKTTHNLGIVGPQTLALLGNASRDNISTDMTVEIAGFEGEWFDPQDVQGYLEEKGIFIDPASSFAEAEIIEWSPSPSSASVASPAAQPPSPAEHGAPPVQRSSPLTVGQVRRLKEEGANFSQWNDFTNMELGAVGFSDAQMGSWMNFVQPGKSVREFNSNAPGETPIAWEDVSMESLQNELDAAVQSASQTTTPLPRKKTIIIDVTKLVEVLTVCGACIGRTPGFRRRDIDRAVAISSFDAF